MHSYSRLKLSRCFVYVFQLNGLPFRVKQRLTLWGHETVFWLSYFKVGFLNKG